MGQSTNKRKDSQTGNLPVNDTPVEETLLIEQRLRSLCRIRRDSSTGVSLLT